MRQTDYTHQNYIHQEQYTPIDQVGQSQPVTMQKRIGSTNYRVSVHFSNTSTETVNDKITRLIKNETASREVSE